MSNKDAKAARRLAETETRAALGPEMPMTSKKRRSRWLKVIGATLLLIAFGMQMEQTRLAAIANDRNQSAQLDGRADMRALANENLYFTEKLATGQDDADKLRQAAIQYYEGRASMMATSPADRDEVSRRLAELFQSANAVHDLNSFNAFMKLHNDAWLSGHQTELKGLIESDRGAKDYGKIYMVLYVLGSIAVILGTWWD
jgi:hypothetical protein